MTPGGNPSTETAAPAEKRNRPQLCSWVLLISAIVLKASLISICLVAPFFHSGDQPTALQQKFSELQCILEVLQGKEQGWICCPNGWKRFQKSCYYLSTDKMSWAESVQNCTGMGSQLVVIDSKAEQEFLFNLAKGVFANAYETKYYIGLSAYESGQWQWVDQTPYKKSATFWKPGEPNLLFAEKCAAIHVKGKTDPNTYSNWNNILCFTSCYRICELAVKFV